MRVAKSRWQWRVEPPRKDRWKMNEDWLRVIVLLLMGFLCGFVAGGAVVHVQQLDYVIRG